MLLSVVVYNHKLTKGQWLGAAVVFAGISVEAWVKRTGMSLISHALPVYNYCRRRSRKTSRSGEGTGAHQDFIIGLKPRLAFPVTMVVRIYSSLVWTVQQEILYTAVHYGRRKCVI